jgi:amino-acid N-acetyltransferase
VSRVASITAARPDDRAAVEQLLARLDLPIEGAAAALDTAVVARTDERGVEGCAALELYGRDALLRSVAVAPERRSSGLGRALVAAALDLARARGVASVYLLTTTAAGYFSRFGFEPIERSTVPQSVQASQEFSTLCPSSAIAMKMELSPA